MSAVARRRGGCRRRRCGGLDRFRRVRPAHDDAEVAGFLAGGDLIDQGLAQFRPVLRALEVVTIAVLVRPAVQDDRVEVHDEFVVAAVEKVASVHFAHGVPLHLMQPR